MVHVPLQRWRTVRHELIGGQVQLGFNAIPSVLAQVKEGKLRALAVGSTKRARALPDLPTIAGPSRVSNTNMVGYSRRANADRDRNEGERGRSAGAARTGCRAATGGARHGTRADHTASPYSVHQRGHGALDQDRARAQSESSIAAEQARVERDTPLEAAAAVDPPGEAYEVSTESDVMVACAMAPLATASPAGARWKPADGGRPVSSKRTPYGKNNESIRERTARDPRRAP